MTNKKKNKNDTPEEMVLIPRTIIEDLYRIIYEMAENYIDTVKTAAGIKR